MKAGREMSLHVMIFVAVIAFLSMADNGHAQPEASSVDRRYASGESGITDTITIVTVNNRARLCKEPNAGEKGTLARIKTGTKLQILNSTSMKLPAWNVTWYKVNYQGKNGWVSEFDTDMAK